MNTPGVYTNIVIDTTVLPASIDSYREFKNICSLWIHNTGTVPVNIGFNTFNPGDSFQFLDERNTVNTDITLDIKFLDKVVPGCEPVRELQFMTKTMTICKCSQCAPSGVLLKAKEIPKCPICS